MAVARLADGRPFAVEIVNVNDGQTKGPALGLRFTLDPTRTGYALLRFGAVRDVWLCDMRNDACWRDLEIRSVPIDKALKSVEGKLERGWSYLADVSPPWDMRARVEAVPKWSPGAQIMDLAADHGWRLVCERRNWRVYRSEDWVWWVVKNGRNGLVVAQVPDP